MNQLVALMLASLSCSNPPMSFRDFYSKFYLSTAEVSVAHWSYRAMESPAQAFGRLADAQADYAEYRAERADKCLRGRASLSPGTKGDKK